MSESSNDIYGDIFVSGDSLDRELLARTASPFIQIFTDGNIPEIVFKPSAENFTVRQKLLVYLLGRKILKDADKLSEDEHEGLTPSELEAGTHISGGTIRPVLKKLLDERLLQKEDSMYYVTNYSLQKVNSEIVGE